MFTIDRKEGILRVHQNALLIKSVQDPVFKTNQKFDLVIKSKEAGEGITIIDPSLFVPLDYKIQLERNQLSKEVAA